MPSNHDHDDSQLKYEYGDAKGSVVRSLRTVPVTEQRRPFMDTEPNAKLTHPGTARANIAPTAKSPKGTTEDDWATEHAHQTILQQHCDFFDTDRDGVVWPIDTYKGFYKLGFGILLSLLAMFIIHVNFSYPTLSSWIPDPFFRIYLVRVHRDKHGSDTGTYDNEGRFVPQKFEEIFSKYAGGRDYITFWEVVDMIKGQRCVADIIGWGGAIFEWLATYIMLWPEDGRLMKEDIRATYDGSIFYKLAERRARNKGY